MKLSKYFETAIGRGVLATANGNGKVDIILYVRPHIIDEETVAFLMIDPVTHQNLQSNPHAAYLFLEEGPEHSGKRLILSKIKEEEGGELIESLRNTTFPETKVDALVYFKIEEVLPLVDIGERKEAGARA